MMGEELYCLPGIEFQNRKKQDFIEIYGLRPRCQMEEKDYTVELIVVRGELP